jgi:hypothetical protein
VPALRPPSRGISLHHPSRLAHLMLANPLGRQLRERAQKISGDQKSTILDWKNFLTELLRCIVQYSTETRSRAHSGQYRRCSKLSGFAEVFRYRGHREEMNSPWSQMLIDRLPASYPPWQWRTIWLVKQSETKFDKFNKTNVLPLVRLSARRLN